MLLLLVLLFGGRSVDLLEDFYVDDIERHGQARRLVGKRGVDTQYGDLAGVSDPREGDV